MYVCKDFHKPRLHFDPLRLESAMNLKEGRLLLFLYFRDSVSQLSLEYIFHG
jgi:hypothetical protein